MFRFEPKSFAFRFFLAFTHYYLKEKCAFQRIRLITLSILSINCNLYDVRDGTGMFFSE